MNTTKEPIKQIKKPVSVSMTDEEKKILADKAEKNGRSLSNFLIWSAMQA